MELDITRYVLDTNHGQISGSRAELGDDAARYTWRNAQAAAETADLLTTPEALSDARTWLTDFGAWSADELDAMPDNDVRALVLQFISGDVREAQSIAPDDDNAAGIDWDAYQEAAEAGRISGSFYRGDDGAIYFYMGL